MLKGRRFVWFYWTQSVKASWQETDTSYIFTGEIKAFQYLNSKATHYRRIVINKYGAEWLVTDQVTRLDGLSKQQIWHPNHKDLVFESDGQRHYFNSYNSHYYGIYSTQKSIFFEFNHSITTKISFEK